MYAQEIKEIAQKLMRKSYGSLSIEDLIQEATFKLWCLDKSCQLRAETKISYIRQLIKNFMLDLIKHERYEQKSRYHIDWALKDMEDNHD